MTGLDTNVLVRYLVQDDPRQAAEATRVIEQAPDSCFVGAVVLCELVRVLRGPYGLDKESVSAVLEQVLATVQLEIEDKDLALAALDDFRASKVDFADCLIGRRNRSAGCDETVTFDKSLRTVEGFRVLT